MATEKKTLAGGARKGAGRKPISEADKVKQRSVALSEAHWFKFKSLGGAKWLRCQLDELDAKP